MEYNAVLLQHWPNYTLKLAHHHFWTSRFLIISTTSTQICSTRQSNCMHRQQLFPIGIGSSNKIIDCNNSRRPTLKQIRLAKSCAFGAKVFGKSRRKPSSHRVIQNERCLPTSWTPPHSFEFIYIQCLNAVHWRNQLSRYDKTHDSTIQHNLYSPHTVCFVRISFTWVWDYFTWGGTICARCRRCKPSVCSKSCEILYHCPCNVRFFVVVGEVTRNSACHVVVFFILKSDTFQRAGAFVFAVSVSASVSHPFFLAHNTRLFYLYGSLCVCVCVRAGGFRR